MASKLLNLVALSSLAVLAVTFGPASTNALSTGHVHMNRHIDHAPIAKRKRDNSKRCKVRSSTISSAAPSTTASASGNSAEPARKLIPYRRRCARIPFVRVTLHEHASPVAGPDGSAAAVSESPFGATC